MKDILLGIPCDEDPKHTAIFYCIVCESNMCDECSKRTHTGRVLSKHCRVPVSEKPLSRTMCPYHSAYAIEFVCQVVSSFFHNELQKRKNVYFYRLNIINEWYYAYCEQFTIEICCYLSITEFHIVERKYGVKTYSMTYRMQKKIVKFFACQVFLLKINLLV